MELPDDYMVFDIETDSLNPFTCKIDRIGFLWTGKYEATKEYREVNYRRIRDSKRSTHQSDPSRILFRNLLEDPRIALVAHNAAFDLQVLQQNGFVFKGQLHDTMLLLKALRTDFPSYALKPLNFHLFGNPCLADRNLETWFKEHKFTKDCRDMSQAPNHLVERYCKADVKMTDRLFRYGVKRLGNKATFYQIEMDTLKALLKIEREDIYVDRKFCGNSIRRNAKKSKVLEESLNFNPRSPQQLGARLEDSGYRVERTAKGNICTDEQHLKLYKRQNPSELIDSVFKIRGLAKISGTYLENLLAATSERTPYFHPHFNQSLAVTRRFSSSGFYGVEGQVTPGNMQNFPKKVRRAIIAPPGYLVASIDMSQIEPRMLAHLIERRLGDSIIADCYRKDPSYNLYLHVAYLVRKKNFSKKSKVYDQFKETVLALAYGSGIQRTADQLDISYEKSKELRDEVHRIRPQIKEIQRRMTAQAERYGYVTDSFGADYQFEKGKEYVAVNKFCQGCSGTVFKVWLAKYDEYVEQHDTPDKLWNLLHDEIDLYVLDDGCFRYEERLMTYCDLLKDLEVLFELPITADFKVGLHWGEC